MLRNHSGRSGCKAHAQPWWINFSEWYKYLETIDTEVINAILIKEPAAAKSFAHSALVKPKDIPLSTLALIAQANKNNPTLYEQCTATFKCRMSTENRVDILCALSKMDHRDRGLFIDMSHLTPTEAHIVSTPDVVAENPYYFTDQKLKDMVNKIIDAEREHQQEHYTFVHGQRWEYLLAERLYTDLWSAHADKPTHSFLFAHIRNRDYEKEQKIYTQIITRGRTDAENRQYLLFLNAAFFGNSHNSGSSTAHYFAHNENVGNISISLKQVFELNGDSDIYEKYAQELQALENKYKALNKKNDHGNILFFAIPKKLAKDYVYLAQPGGSKKTIEVVDPTRTSLKKFFSGETYKTNDMDEVMDNLTLHAENIRCHIWDNYPIDQNEFCLIMTGKAMDPESGIKMKAFNAADPQKMQAFWNKYDALMAKIKADIEAKQAGKPLPSQESHLFEKFLELLA